MQLIRLTEGGGGEVWALYAQVDDQLPEKHAADAHVDDQHNTDARV
jgi:hypothetical protein